MTLDPTYVRRHIERALAAHEHGDACEADECCPSGEPLASTEAPGTAPPGVTAPTDPGRLPPLTEGGLGT